MESVSGAIMHSPSHHRTSSKAAVRVTDEVETRATQGAGNRVGVAVPEAQCTASPPPAYDCGAITGVGNAHLPRCEAFCKNKEPGVGLQSVRGSVGGVGRKDAGTNLSVIGLSLCDLCLFSP